MNIDRSPHNFLLHLRCHAPELARLPDGVLSLGWSQQTLLLKMDTDLWPGSEVAGRIDELTAQARRFFGPESNVHLDTAPADPHRLPFPVSSSKYWNHVAFWSWDSPEGSRVFALPKPDYAKWLKCGGPLPEGEKILNLHLPPGDQSSPLEAALESLPAIADSLCALAREHFSYAQLVTPFPGHRAADALEARLAATLQWGTPATPGPILRKFVGALHYADPETPLPVFST